jgi:PPP family 3-phenylpropionic acid transporter
MPIEKSLRKIGGSFALNYFLLFTVYGVSTPYLQLILRRIGYSHSAVGLYLGLFELTGILGPVFLAKKADTLGEFKPFLSISTALILVGLPLLVLLPHPIFTTMAIIALSLGIKTPVPVLDASLMAVLNKNPTQVRAPFNYATIRAIGSVGFVVVAVILQTIPGFDNSGAGVLALIMAFCALLFALGQVSLPETGKKSGIIPKTTGEKKDTSSNRWLDSTFFIGLGVIGLGRLSMAPISSFFSLYLTEQLKWDAVSGMWALSATVEIPMMLYAGHYIRKKSPMSAINISSYAIVARLLVYALFPTPAGAIIGQLLHSLCYGFYLPAAIAFVNLKTPPAKKATGMALYMSIGMGIPTFLGSAVGGMVIEKLGFRWLFALFSVFSIASIALYQSHKKNLDSVF